MTALRATIILSILGISLPVAQTRAPRLKPVIRQVDHILIQAGDPKGLFDFFAGTLKLPVAWPIAEYSGFTSGGVSAGNVNLEVLRFADQKPSSRGSRTGARFMGLGLEPVQLTDCLTQLAARGIAYDPPIPYNSKLPDGSEGTLWTNVPLSRISKPGLSVFLCEYSPAFLDVEIRRNQLGGQLALRKGGPLGIRSVMEIVISTPDLARDVAAWQRLLALPARSRTELRAVSGPSLHFVAAQTSGIVRITLLVDSVSEARDFLAGKGMLRAVSPNGVSIEPSKVQGLDIRLTGR